MSSAKCFESNNGNSIRLLYNTAYNEPMPRCITNLRVRARYIDRGKSGMQNGDRGGSKKGQRDLSRYGGSGASFSIMDEI